MQSGGNSAGPGAIAAPATGDDPHHDHVPGSSVQRDHHYRIDATQGCSSWFNNSTL